MKFGLFLIVTVLIVAAAIATMEATHPFYEQVDATSAPLPTATPATGVQYVAQVTLDHDTTPDDLSGVFANWLSDQADGR